MVDAMACSGASAGATQVRLGGITVVVHPLHGVDPQAVAEIMAIVLGGQPLFRPEAEADPFQVLQQLTSDTAAALSPAQGSWLLVTTELAAHHGPGANWCTALAAFRRPLLLVVAPRPGWEGQARAYGALARQSGIPLLGVTSHGEPHAPHFDPALELGLPWLGHLPTEGAPTTQAWQDQLWLLREQLWLRWWQLCRTEQVMALSTGDLSAPGASSPGQQRQHQQHEVQHHGGGQ
ncbi:hypothetical protein [Candidatus Synechococcus spongiarum]|uniref:hypothetical protein n=1 Tax=Candidatus Synechococcus spongiarum TaxID=431041 RepID=UPI0015D676D7|nr:hypothetical protein [Candidatus Synechococcus spongiarum]